MKEKATRKTNKEKRNIEERQVILKREEKSDNVKREKRREDKRDNITRERGEERREQEIT